jgi:hypothetical protein
MWTYRLKITDRIVFGITSRRLQERALKHQKYVKKISDPADPRGKTVEKQMQTKALSDLQPNAKWKATS